METDVFIWHYKTCPWKMAIILEQLIIRLHRYLYHKSWNSDIGPQITDFDLTVNVKKCDISQGIDRNLVICTDEEWDIKNLISAETGAQVSYQ